MQVSKSKLSFFIFSLVFLFSLFSCASSDNLVNPQEEILSEANLIDDYSDDDGTKSDSSKASLPITVDQTKLPWLGKNQGSFENQVGAIKIKAKGRLGTFNIFSLDSEGKSTPIFSTVEEFTTTSFYLKAGKNVYKLSAGNNISASAEKTERGMRLHYLVPNVAVITVDLACISSDSKRDADVVKVTARIKSLIQRHTDFSLKIVMDTALGEKNKFHFYNAEIVPIKNEVMYRTFQKSSRFVITKNETTTAQFLLTGADITTPEFVALGNYDTLGNLEWEPNMLIKRSFDTVRNYNNSAICINWPQKKVAPWEETVTVFYIGLAADTAFPNGESLILSTDPKYAQMQTNIQDEISPRSNRAEDSADEGPTTLTDLGDAAANGYVKFDVEKITKEKLRPEYIQSLLDRIAELEENDATLNRSELLLLNAELDTILEILRNQ